MTTSNKNFLVLGHTGVGKSSLINYLTNSDAAKVGCGNPCTPKNEWKPITCPGRSDNEELNFFDSWGLEANKTEEWQKLINEKLTIGWSKDAICGVIYCFSYTHRIEDFELKMIKNVLETGYHVLIVLTNADCHDLEAKQADYKNRIDIYLKDYAGKYKTVNICSVNIKKLVGSTKQRGRDEALDILEKFSTENLYRIYCNALDAIQKEIDAEINKRIYALKKPVISGTPNPILIVLGAPASLLLAPIWDLFSNDTDEYYKIKTIFEKDIEKLKEFIIPKIHQFGIVYSALYNVSFNAPELEFVDKLISVLLFGRGLDLKKISLGNVYMKTLSDIRDSVYDNIQFLKRSKTYLRFK